MKETFNVLRPNMPAATMTDRRIRRTKHVIADAIDYSGR